ncbi:MAG: hypothetical protein GY930_01090 [bacterium]|nr:hypothetical protein [bacterium]
MNEPLYLALIGDMVASRHLSDRKATQEKLLMAICDLNDKPELGSDALAAPLTLTAGDEVQALVRSPEAAVVLIQELTDRFGGAGKFPAFVFGLGLGPLSTGPVHKSSEPPPNPALLDGPCFHNARRALEAAQKQGQWVLCEGFDSRVGLALNAIFGLMGAIRSTWTGNQCLHTYHVRSYRFQKDWAGEFGVSPSVVSESLQAACFDEIKTGEIAAKSLLQGVPLFNLEASE